MRWIKQLHEAKKPYFAYIATNAPHSPMIAPGKYTKRFPKVRPLAVRYNKQRENGGIPSWSPPSLEK